MQGERKELHEKAKEAAGAAKEATLAKAQELKVAAAEKAHEKLAETKEQQAQRCAPPSAPANASQSILQHGSAWAALHCNCATGYHCACLL